QGLLPGLHRQGTRGLPEPPPGGPAVEAVEPEPSRHGRIGRGDRGDAESGIGADNRPVRGQGGFHSGGRRVYPNAGAAARKERGSIGARAELTQASEVELVAVTGPSQGTISYVLSKIACCTTHTSFNSSR